MLDTLVDATGNKVLIDGFYENIEPLTKEEEESLALAAKTFDMERAAKNIGVERFMADDPLSHLKLAQYGTSMNLDGIWAGNMFPGGSGAILPNKVTSKHNFRYVPNMTGPDIVAKLRKHLDKHGFQDVEINVVGDVPWAKMSYDNDLARAIDEMQLAFGGNRRKRIPHESILGGALAPTGGYWPAYLFAGDVIDIPIVSAGLGLGGNAHAANEFYVIEGAAKVFGMANNEKSIVTALYNYAGLNNKAPESVAAVTPDARTMETTKAKSVAPGG
jgi:acetylornithine deacetylase/succinyl-diaminopimelate desuccinylase-like protein